MREAGFMLPQSENSLTLIQQFADDPPTESFPIKEAEELLSSIECKKEGVRRYRCKLCFTEFEVEEGEEPVCPMCGAKGDDLELL